MNIRRVLAILVVLSGCGELTEGETGMSQFALRSPPEVVGEEFLKAVGIDTAGLFQLTPRDLCSVYLHTTGSNEEERTITCAPQKGFLLDSPAWLDVVEADKCSYSYTYVEGGTDYSRIDEIEHTYGRAIDLALKAGKAEIAIKLGQMRDYSKSAYQDKSATGVYVLWAKAKSRWYQSSGAFCNLAVRALLRKV